MIIIGLLIRLYASSRPSPTSTGHLADLIFDVKRVEVRRLSVYICVGHVRAMYLETLLTDIRMTAAC